MCLLCVTLMGEVPFLPRQSKGTGETTRGSLAEKLKQYFSVVIVLACNCPVELHCVVWRLLQNCPDGFDAGMDSCSGNVPCSSDLHGYLLACRA